MKNFTNENHNNFQKAQMNKPYAHLYNDALAEVFQNLKGQYFHPVKQTHSKNHHFRHINMQIKSNQMNSENQMDSSNLAYLNKPQFKKKKKPKSKVITIIDNDDPNDSFAGQQQTITQKIQYSQNQRMLDLIKLPIILNKKSKLTKDQKEKQNQFLSYIYSQLTLDKNTIQKSRQKLEINHRSDKSLNQNKKESIDFENKVQQRKFSQNNKGLLFPLVNRNRTISQAANYKQPKIEQKSKKNQIKLSGTSVIPAERQKSYHQKYYLPQPKTSRTRPINLISSEMIYNNPVSNVKKSVYQLLIKKSNSCY